MQSVTPLKCKASTWYNKLRQNGLLETMASIAIPPNSYCHSYGSVLKEEFGMFMNVFWCSLGVISMVHDMVVDGSFNVLVVCVLFLIVDRRKNRANSPRARFLVEDLGSPGEATHL